MAVPFLYAEFLQGRSIVLDEETSKYLIQVLRKVKGEEVLITNGKGAKAAGIIEDDHRKKAVIRIEDIVNVEEKKQKVSIGISLVKNTSRFEWFLEKATEIGVDEIIPLLCARTEKEKFRIERLQGILVSAMLQSQQCWLPKMTAPVDFSDFINNSTSLYQRKFIAHCIDAEEKKLPQINRNGDHSSLILIGPEGDFTLQEIELALQKAFEPVSLGNTRLRTETAGMVAAVMLVNGGFANKAAMI